MPVASQGPILGLDVSVKLPARADEDRIAAWLLQLLTAAYGTKQTYRGGSRMSAFGAKRTSRAGRSDADDPKRT